jgi:scyllo-inositol 2-dehydrogenase (NADP+)
MPCFYNNQLRIMSETIIQTGLASYGMSGIVYHGPLLAAHSGFQLRKIVERTSQRSRQSYPEAEIVNSFEALLADPKIQLIIVNTPDPLHFTMAEQALKAGKHVVVEKPFTLTSQEANLLTELARTKGKVLSIFQSRRWHGDFLTVQKIIDNGWLGQLVEYEAHYTRFRNYIVANTWKEGWQEDTPGSGILYNLGSHLIDQALVLFGLPERVTADVRIQRPGGKVPDAYELIMEYGSLKVTLKSSYLVRETGPSFVLHGTEGSFIKYGSDPQEEAMKNGLVPGKAGWGQEPEAEWGLLNTQLDGLHLRGKVETLPGNYLTYYDQLHRAIVQGSKPPVTAEEATSVIRIIEAAKESSHTKRSVVIGT